MLSDQARLHLEKLLDLGDRLNRLQRAIDDEMAGRRPEGTVRERIRRTLERSVEEGLLDPPLPGFLGRLERRRRFSREEVLVLLLLLSRRVQWGDEGLSGREILEVVFDSSWGILDGAEVLEEDAPLRASGAVGTYEGNEAADLLDQWFAISERVFRAVRRELRRGAGRKARREPVRPYRDAREHLLEVGRLTALYQRRAQRLFGPPPEGEDPRHPAESAERAVDRCREAETRIRRRLQATESSAGFPIVRLAREHHLLPEETAAIALLLFQEVYTGSSVMPVVEVVKALSTSEDELLVRRAIFRREGALARVGLVAVEEEPLEREFSAEAYLPGWVVDELLGAGSQGGGITPEVRKDFASYLARLQDSGQFFRDLGEPEGDRKAQPPAAPPGKRGQGRGRGRGQRGGPKS